MFDKFLLANNESSSEINKTVPVEVKQNTSTADSVGNTVTLIVKSSDTGSKIVQIDNNQVMDTPSSHSDSVTISTDTSSGCGKSSPALTETVSIVTSAPTVPAGGSVTDTVSITSVSTTTSTSLNSGLTNSDATASCNLTEPGISEPGVALKLEGSQVEVAQSQNIDNQSTLAENKALPGVTEGSREDTVMIDSKAEPTISTGSLSNDESSVSGTHEGLTFADSNSSPLPDLSMVTAMSSGEHRGENVAEMTV